MPEISFTRQPIIIVDTVEKDTYGNLLFKDKSGNPYKISKGEKNRVKYFETVIVPNMGVQLNYAMSSFGKEYIYSATQVKDMIKQVAAPPTIKPNPLVEAAKKMGAIEMKEENEPRDKFSHEYLTKPSPEAVQSKSTPVKEEVKGNLSFLLSGNSRLSLLDLKTMSCSYAKDICVSGLFPLGDLGLLSNQIERYLVGELTPTQLDANLKAVLNKKG